MKSAIQPADLALVRGTPLFAALSEPVFLRLLESATVQTVSRAEVLFLQGDPVKSCFVVLEGWVKLYRLTTRGDEAIVAIFTRGQSFAEAAAFLQGVFPVSGEAVTEGRLLCIPVEALIGNIRSNPEIGLAMLASTSQHLHNLVQQIEQLKSHTGVQRVAEFLVSLAPVESGACSIGLPYDKALIAGRLGMKPESLSRAFAKLRDVGVLIHQNSVAISDVERLQAYAQEERLSIRQVGS